MSRSFPLGVVLSITTERLLAPFPDVHECVEYLAGGPVWTHQLPRVVEEAASVILAAHPALADIEVPEGLDTFDKVNAFLHGLAIERNVPASIALEPMSAADHTSIGPIDELRMMAPDKSVQVVVVDPREEPHA